ncbi:MAG: LamG-like jellyroll fold domain-containing protein [Candidatus Paceibacterota bacterium]
MRPMNSKKSKTEKAFTLIELLVVIVIVGILAGMVVVNMSGATESAKVAKSKSFSSSLRDSLLMARVSEWNFDEGSGTSVADSWGTNGGTLTNGPVWKTGADCVSGSCLSFSGSSYVLGPDDPSLRITGDITLSFWVKPDTASNSFMAVVTKEYAKEWLIAVDVRGTGRAIAWRHGDGVVEYGTFNNVFIDGNVWYYIACTRSLSPKTITCYKNGNKVGTSSYSKDVVSGSLPLTIGSGASNYYFRGSIDEVRIYNQIIPSSAIKNNYLAGLEDLFSKGSISKENYYQRLADLNLGYAISK